MNSRPQIVTSYPHFGACPCVRLYLCVCYLEGTVGTMLNKSAYRAVPSTTMSVRSRPRLSQTQTQSTSLIIYPGVNDFVVVTSDGVRFHLSRTTLTTTSGFFADMFTVGGGSSSTRSSEEQTVNASEDHVILDALFAISYSHPEKPKPDIVTFAQIAELIRVAEKYRMRHALDYLSSHLTLPRIQDATFIEPFTVTHSLATLSLSLTHGFSIPARLALKEAVNATNSIWDITSDDAALGGLTLDFRMLKRIQRMRTSRANAYKRFIEGLLPAPTWLNHPPECATCIRIWRAELLKKYEEAPNSAAFSVAFHKGCTCSRCGQSLMSQNLANSMVTNAGSQTRAPNALGTGPGEYRVWHPVRITESGTRSITSSGHR